ncbi:MAG TPA: hypothetical protein VMN57_02990 [Anaerolineales bacterium]|nr:hypothetical protein [Anaerolineales bacterium]
MDRLWPGTLAFGLLLLTMWRFGEAFTDLYRPELAGLVLAAGVYATLLGLFALLARRMGYVRAFDRYLLIATPFFRFKTSYERLRGVRSVDFHRLFDLEDLSWAQERYIAPLIGSTAVVVRLTGYPVSTGVLGIFFQRYLISQKDTELVFVVPDWMGFSVELDSRYNKYRQARGMRKRTGGFQRGVS